MFSRSSMRTAIGPPEERNADDDGKVIKFEYRSLQKYLCYVDRTPTAKNRGKNILKLTPNSPACNFMSSIIAANLP